MAYGTTQELQFIRGLGTHCIDNAPREKLLSNYIKGAKNRVNWGDIDKKRVLDFAKKELKKA